MTKTTVVRDAVVVVEENGYRFPERCIDGYIRTTTHRTEAAAQKAADKDGAVAFVLRWQSEIGNDVFANYVTEATWFARRSGPKG